jgi:hypothetical protein
MTSVKGGAIGAGAALAVLASSMAGAALAQDQPKTPPSWDALVRCAQMSDDDASLACFRQAMKEAGFAPKPAEVAAEKRKHFGLSIPQVNILRRHAKEEGQQQAQGGGQAAPEAEGPKPGENENEVYVTLSRVAILYNGKLLFITTDGAIWEQTDDTEVEPRPQPGMMMKIHKGQLGGYFCDASQYKSVRCARSR